AIVAKEKQDFIKQIKDSTQIAGVTAILLGSGIMLFAPLVISFITKDVQVQAIAEQHAIYAGIYIVVSFVAFQLDGVFIGATRSKEMRNTSIISLLVLIGVGTLLTKYYGNIGLWVSFIIYVIARGVSLGVYTPKLVRELF